MKYIFPLLLATAAVWGATHDTIDRAPRVSEPEARTGAAPRSPDPFWVEANDEAEGEEPADPHAGLFFESDDGDDDDPHAGLFVDDVSSLGMCPRDDADETGPGLGSDDPDPHLNARSLAPGVELPRGGVARSQARNGHGISELHAQRAALSDQLVRVRGVVVKRTDGILGETYLHLRDGTGSAERQDDDLTVTTNQEFALGETVELEGRLQIDQDLGLGYRYAALLSAATRVASH